MFGIFILLIIIGIAVGDDEASSASSSKAPTGLKSSYTPPKTQSWSAVESWSGKATKNTETFRIDSDLWRISWKTKPADLGEFVFQIYIYKDGELVNLAANVIGTDEDSTVMRGAGNYYLNINTGQPYTIKVEQSQ